MNGSTKMGTSLHMREEVKKSKKNRQLSKPIHQLNLTAEEARQIVVKRLPYHFKSSRKAFLAAKAGSDPRTNQLGFKDFSVFLRNMNVDIPDEAVRGLFQYLDNDNSGVLSAPEFIKAFGHSISGEQAHDINDSSHLSFFNKRPDDRVHLAPPPHPWTFEEVKATLAQRLGTMHTSTSKAFFAAKRSNNKHLGVADLRRVLFNLNMDIGDEIVQKLFRDIDKAGSGEVTASEFSNYFGKFISGDSGSLDHKPTWYLKELDKISTQLDKIDDPAKAAGQQNSPVFNPGPGRSSRSYTGPKLSSTSSMTKAQELKFMRKFGVSTKEALPATSPFEATKFQEAFSATSQAFESAKPRTPRSARPLTPQRTRPRTPLSGRRPQSAGSMRPQSAGSTRPQSAGSTRPQSAGPRITVTKRFAMPGDENKPEVMSTRDATSYSGKGIQDFTNEELRNELLDRRAAAREAQGLEVFDNEALRQELLERRASSHRRARSVSVWSRKRAGEPNRQPMNREWNAPSIRFNSTSNTQSVHSRSTMALKLERARKIAELLEVSKSRQRRSRSVPRGAHFRPHSSVKHERPFRVL